jgi:hypothetical protein
MLDFLIGHAEFFFLFLNGRGNVEAVIGPEIEEKYILRRVDTLSSNLFEDRMFASKD